MLVTAIEAKPLRSLDRVRVELEPGIVSVIGPNGTGKTNLVEALYFALTGRSFRTSRSPRPDPLRRLARPRRGDDPRRGRDRAPAARLGQPQRRPPPPAGRRPGGPGDDRPQPTAGGGLRPRSAERWSRDRRPSAAPTSTASSPPAGRLARSCASATARRSPSATRCSRGSPPGYGSPADLRIWDAGLAEAAAPLIEARAEAVGELAAPFAAAAAELGLEEAELEYAPRAGGIGGGDPRRAWRSAASRTSASAAAPGAPTSTS